MIGVDTLFGVDWDRLFIPDTPLLEIAVRGTIVYLSLFLMLRLVLRRETGAIGVTDLLVLVLIADAAQNAMAGDYYSITDGVMLVAVIIGWNYIIEWLAFHYPSVRRVVHPPPLPLIKNGRMIRRNMAHELVSEDELMSALRLHGVEDPADVKLAYMESDGRISIIQKNGRTSRDEEEEKPRGV